MGSDVDRVDLIIVGGGLAGLACAIEASRLELAALVVERGDRTGSKNVSGGRLYMAPVRPLFPDGFFDDAPMERAVTHEQLVLLSPSSSLTLDFTSEAFRQGPPSSFTVLRARLDRWLGEKVEASGAFVVPQAVATELIRENGRVKGVRAGDEELLADVVVAADGALSFVGREAGLAGPLEPAGCALGIKEVIKLDPARIEDRFALLPGEGCARLFLGDITAGMAGGGFLYTNTDSISLGVVIPLDDLAGRPADARGSHELLDAMKERSEIGPLVEGGEIVEYSAHLIPEPGPDRRPGRVADGLLVAGDAAGLVINHGITVRGMDLALASGVLAARAVGHAKKAGDAGAATLSEYERLLAESFVGKDMQRHAHVPAFLERRRLYERYPAAVCEIVEGLFEVGPDGKQRLYPRAARLVRKTLLDMDTLSDLWAARKL